MCEWGACVKGRTVHAEGVLSTVAWVGVEWSGVGTCLLVCLLVCLPVCPNPCLPGNLLPFGFWHAARAMLHCTCPTSHAAAQCGNGHGTR